MKIKALDTNYTFELAYQKFRDFMKSTVNFKFGGWLLKNKIKNNKKKTFIIVANDFSKCLKTLKVSAFF